MSTASRFRNACLALCLATCTCTPGVAWAANASADAAGAAKASPTTRLSGETSAETAQAIALATFSKADTAILATDNGFADAMSATGLAGALDAPILLTGRDELSPAARDAIERLGITNVIIVGGGAVISSDVASDVAELLGVSAKDVENNRLYGNEAEDTSVACAAELTRLNGPQDKAIVTSSVNFQDALSISSFAYKYQVPIFLESSGATSADRALPDLAITCLLYTSSPTKHWDARSFRQPHRPSPTNPQDRTSGPPCCATKCPWARYPARANQGCPPSWAC